MSYFYCKWRVSFRERSDLVGSLQSTAGSLCFAFGVFLELERYSKILKQKTNSSKNAQNRLRTVDWKLPTVRVPGVWNQKGCVCRCLRSCLKFLIGDENDGFFVLIGGNFEGIASLRLKNFLQLGQKRHFFSPIEKF